MLSGLFGLVSSCPCFVVPSALSRLLLRRGSVLISTVVGGAFAQNRRSREGRPVRQRFRKLVDREAKKDSGRFCFFLVRRIEYPFRKPPTHFGTTIREWFSQGFSVSPTGRVDTPPDFGVAHRARTHDPALPSPSTLYGGLGLLHVASVQLGQDEGQ